MEFLQHALDLLNQSAVAMPWDALIAAGTISPVLVAIKKWLDVQSEKVMIVLVIVMAGIAAGISYLLTAPVLDPSVIGIKTALIGFMSQPVYFFIVKPAIAWFHNEVAKAAQLNIDMRSAAEPAGGLNAITNSAVNNQSIYGAGAYGPAPTMSQTPPANTTVIQDFKQ